MTSKETQESAARLHIAVLGAGKMGGILVQAFLRSGLFPRENVAATVAHEARATALTKQFGIPVTTDNREAAQQADIILLGVKPQQLHDVVSGIAPALRPGKLLISFAASVKPPPSNKRPAATSRSFAPCRTRPQWSAPA